MNRDNNFSSKIIELETITPLYIRGKTMKYGEGMLKGKDGKVYLIDNDKLCQYIYDAENGGKRNDYVQLYADEMDMQNNFSLEKFLKRHNIFPSDDKLKEMAKGVTHLFDKSHFVQNGKGEHFIPGSSIKGAIRNAILWKLIEDSIGLIEDKKNWINNYLRDLFSLISEIEESLKIFDQAKSITNRSEKEKKISEAAAKIKSAVKKEYIKDNRFFEKIVRDSKIDFPQVRRCRENLIGMFKKDASNICYKKSTFSEKSFNENIPAFEKNSVYNTVWKELISKDNKNISFYDFFRIVKVSDANFLTKKLGNKIASPVCLIDNKIYQKDIKIPLECIMKGSNAQFRISIDVEMATRFFGSQIPFYLQSVENLLETVDEFFRMVWACEEEFFCNKSSISNDLQRDKKYKIDPTDIYNLYKRMPSNFHLFRTGWGGGLISKAQFIHIDTNLRASTRDIIRYNGSSVAPKSRCLLVEGVRAVSPLGWCSLKILKDRDLPGVLNDHVENRHIKSDTPSHIKMNTGMGAKLTEAQGNRFAKLTTKSSNYKKGDRIKNTSFTKEGDAYFVKIRGQEQSALLIGKPAYGANVLTVTVEEVVNETVTKVKKSV